MCIYVKLHNSSHISGNFWKPIHSRLLRNHLNIFIISISWILRIWSELIEDIGLQQSQKDYFFLRILFQKFLERILFSREIWKFLEKQSYNKSLNKHTTYDNIIFFIISPIELINYTDQLFFFFLECNSVPTELNDGKSVPQKIKKRLL